MVLGSWTRKDTLYGGEGYSVLSNGDLAGRLKAAINRLPRGRYVAEDFLDGNNDGDNNNLSWNCGVVLAFTHTGSAFILIGSFWIRNLGRMPSPSAPIQPSAWGSAASVTLPATAS